MSETPIADQVAWRLRLGHAAQCVGLGHTVEEIATRCHVDLSVLERAVLERHGPPGGPEATKAYGRAMQLRFQAVPRSKATAARIDELLSVWRAALDSVGFVEREEPGRHKWRRETTGLKMTLDVSLTTLGRITETPTDYIAVGVRWSVSARDGNRWRRVEGHGRSLFPSDVSGDTWHIHDGIATTLYSGLERNVFPELCSLGPTLAGLANELSDRVTARRFVAVLEYTRVVG